MTFTQWLGWLLGVEDVKAIDRIQLTFAALWAKQFPVLMVFAVVLLCAIAGLFYTVRQKRGRLSWRLVLAGARAVVLALVFLFLAEPNLVVKLTNEPKPWLWLLFDGTDSMAIRDDYPDAERARLDAAAGLAAKEKQTATSERPPSPSRISYLQAWLKRQDQNVVAKLSEKYRLKGFVFDRPDVVRELPPLDAAEIQKGLDAWTSQLTTTGQVTALGKSLEDLALRHASGHLGGILIASDFDQNAGPPAATAARKLVVPVYALGIGADAAVDISVELQAPLLLKKAERTAFSVTLRQTGLDDRQVTVRLVAKPLSGTDLTPRIIGEKTVTLSGPDVPTEFDYTPDETGRFELQASVEPQVGELVDQNNVALRTVDIRDDFLRLMFVEYEPTWEWRFIKEVFHRDKLVGMRGFRTFLRSADPTVRKSNELFLPTITPKRSDFFANDVIFLGDMPTGALSTRFCEMTREFVEKFGGGLVILSGPRFGPAQLANTPLADMLPVIVDPGTRFRDAQEFRPRLTSAAAEFPFMQLGSTPAENARAWDNMGELPWYQPVSRLHPLGTALAVHPTDRCADGQTPQPLIAVRRYGNGEVIYVGFNETWRMRRKYGEQYYRQFWGQMIYRLGLSHALGSQKRFVARTDRTAYQPDEQVVLTVEAYNANFEPLTEDDLPQRALAATLSTPSEVGQPATQTLAIPQLRSGVFETRVPALQTGEHRISVMDPVSHELSEVIYQVNSVSVERRSAVRNVALQQELAVATGGQSYDLGTADRILKDFQPATQLETSIQVYSLWKPYWITWVAFGLVVGLLLVEWLVRKALNLV